MKTVNNTLRASMIGVALGLVAASSTLHAAQAPSMILASQVAAAGVDPSKRATSVSVSSIDFRLSRTV